MGWSLGSQSLGGFDSGLTALRATGWGCSTAAEDPLAFTVLQVVECASHSVSFFSSQGKVEYLVKWKGWPPK